MLTAIDIPTDISSIVYFLIILWTDRSIYFYLIFIMYPFTMHVQAFNKANVDNRKLFNTGKYMECSM